MKCEDCKKWSSWKNDETDRYEKCCINFHSSRWGEYTRATDGCNDVDRKKPRLERL